MATLGSTGLIIDSLNSIITSLEDSLKGIYGNDINIDSNSPDGQAIQIYAQAVRDIQELLLSIYQSFDPDQAVGVNLDQRVAYNNIKRQEGTFTIQEVEITVDRNLTLEGLSDTTTPYTVSDNNGNNFQLIATNNLLANTTTPLTFQAENIGVIETQPNTITNQVTIVLGVTNVNNPSVALEIGTDEETDASLRLRRQRSTANASQAFINGLIGALLDIDGVSEAQVYENKTDATDANGIPPHSSWSIVEGGDPNDIANVISQKASTGSGFKGDVEVEVEFINGSTQIIKYDLPTSKDLYIRFEIQATVVGQPFNEAAIKDYITANKAYGIGESAETSSLTTLAREAIDSSGGGGVPLNMEISADDVSYVDFLPVDTLDEKWIIDPSRITITIL